VCFGVASSGDFYLLFFYFNQRSLFQVDNATSSIIMTGSTSSPTDVEISANRQSPTEKYDPLLHLLRMLLVEAYRYQKQTTNLNNNAFHSRSIKALFHQLDYLWEQLQGEPLQKYEFLRGRMALLLLWHNQGPDCGHNYFSRSMMSPPAHMSNVFRVNRQRLLGALRPGELFVSAGGEY
jgi:hypothetical protein